MKIYNLTIALHLFAAFSLAAHKLCKSYFPSFVMLHFACSCPLICEVAALALSLVGDQSGHDMTIYSVARAETRKLFIAFRGGKFQIMFEKLMTAMLKRNLRYEPGSDSGNSFKPGRCC